MEIIKYIVIHLIVSMGFTIKSIGYDQELSVNNGSKCKSNYVTKNKEYVLVKNNAVTDSI